MITRRTAFLGLGGLLVTPAIVRASSLMRLSVPASKAPTYAGLMRARQMLPEQVARDICSVQPIDPQPFLDLYELLCRPDEWE